MGALDKPPTQRFWLIVIALIIAGVGAYMYIQHEIDAANLRTYCQQHPATCPTNPH